MVLFTVTKIWESELLLIKQCVIRHVILANVANEFNVTVYPRSTALIIYDIFGFKMQETVL